MKTKFMAALLAIGSLATTLQAQDKALLYKVTGPGLAKPSYLYGTFHLVCPTDLTITETLKKAVGETQQLYLELDMDDPALMSGMMKAMMMTDGKTMKDLLKPDDYTLVDEYLKKTVNMGLAQVGTFKPIGLLSLMYMGILKCQPESYDLTFARMAAQDKKDVLGLETVDAQLAAFDKIPMQEQLKGVVDMARKPDEARAEFNQMLLAYKAHDIDKMMAQMKTSQFSGGDFAQYEDSLLGERNASWIPVIEKAAREKQTFFAFGAGHLGSDKGIISLLRKKGYTVQGME